MNIIHISAQAGETIIEYFESAGYRVERFDPMGRVAKPIACHPDLLLCKLFHGSRKGFESNIFRGDEALLGEVYPDDCMFNACSTGRFFIHNPRATSAELLSAARRAGLVEVCVAQGYAKCSVAEVDDNSIITADRGIARAASAAGINVLTVSEDGVLLPGYNKGFIGGACGRVGNALVFNGDLSAHPDFLCIKDFLRQRGLDCIYFRQYPLTDIGSIIEEVTP